MRDSATICLLTLCVLGPPALAQTTVPHTFTSGTPALASEVNENFQALATAIDGLTARLDKLEGKTPLVDADVVGTYHASNLQIDTVWVAGPVTPVEAISYEGTFTFAADHTFTYTFTGKQNDHTGPSAESGEVTGAWSLAAGVLTAGSPGETPIVLNCTLACRVMVTTLEGSAAMLGEDAHNNILILVRTD